MHTSATPPAPAGKLEFLSFELGGLEYGVDFRMVKELRTLRSLERFAADGAIISGVAVSRGVIMPIVDMRVAFSPQNPARDPMTDVIILQLSNCVVGMVVDGVIDLVTLEAAQITPIPDSASCDYLIGLGEAFGRRLILVDIDKLMSIRRDSDRKVA